MLFVRSAADQDLFTVTSALSPQLNPLVYFEAEEAEQIPSIYLSTKKRSVEMLS